MSYGGSFVTATSCAAHDNTDAEPHLRNELLINRNKFRNLESTTNLLLILGYSANAMKEASCWESRGFPRTFAPDSFHLREIHLRMEKLNA